MLTFSGVVGNRDLWWERSRVVRISDSHNCQYRTMEDWASRRLGDHGCAGTLEHSFSAWSLAVVKCWSMSSKMVCCSGDIDLLVPIKSMMMSSSRSMGMESRKSSRCHRYSLTARGLLLLSGCCVAEASRSGRPWKYF